MWTLLAKIKTAKRKLRFEVDFYRVVLAIKMLLHVVLPTLLLYFANGEHILSQWVLDNITLPYTVSRYFAVYHEITNSIYGIGGNNCRDCGFIYDLLTNSMINFTTNVTSLESSNTFQNSASCNSVLIGANSMLALDWLGRIWEFDIITRSIIIRNDEKQGSIGSGCMVSNTPNNTDLYICDGNNGNCFVYNLQSDTWTQIASVKLSFRLCTKQIHNTNTVFRGAKLIRLPP